MLINEKLVKDDAQSIAYYLLITEGVNKTKLGELFGSPDQLNQDVLE